MFVYKRSSFFFIKQNDKPSGEERFFNIKAIYTKRVLDKSSLSIWILLILTLANRREKEYFFADTNIKKYTNYVFFREISQ